MSRPMFAALLICLTIGLVGSIFWWHGRQPDDTAGSPDLITAPDPENAAIIIEGVPIELDHGTAVASPADTPGAVITTRYAGIQATADLNSDGEDDTVFIVTQDGGGSGLFYYVVAMVRDDEGYRSTPGYFIGDRIEPLAIRIDASASEAIVTYADRNPDEPMATVPTVRKELKLRLTPDLLLEAAE